MLVLIGAILGALAGTSIAMHRKGRFADILLYGCVYALIFAIIGLFITLIIHRFAG